MKYAYPYPSMMHIDDQYNIMLTPEQFIVISDKDMDYIVNKYNEINIKYPNRTGNDDMDRYICPNCNHVVGYLDDFIDEKPLYCSNCGQKLNWDNAYQNGKIVEGDN